MTDRPKTTIDAPWLRSPAARKVMGVLAAAGGDPRFVGGSVRDAVLGRAASDLDIASRLAPEDAITTLERDGIATVPTGLAHGTVTAVLGSDTFEITTLRRDLATDGRHAEVAFTDDWREDAARRDFTMNALSADIDGNVYDYFGGLEDLRAGRVACVGEATARFREDFLRILRFFRFHAGYALGDYDAEALAAARDLGSNLLALSGERLRQETLKLLAAPNGPAVWRDMVANGIARVYLPEAGDVERLAAVAAIEARLPALLAPDPIRRLAAATLHDARAGESVAARLRLSGEERDRLVFLLQPGETSDPHLPGAVRRAVYRHGNQRTTDRLVLLADHARSDEGLERALELAGVYAAPALPVSGKDVLALGLEPGPEIGRRLKSLETWWLTLELRPTREDCLERLRAG